MSEDARPVGEDDIDAYVDGRVSASTLVRVEALMAAEPALRDRVMADKALRQSLRDRLAPVAAEPIPGRLRVAGMVNRRRFAMRTRLGAAAAAVFLLSLGMGSGWVARGWSGVAGAQNTAAIDAIDAHRVFVVETAHPVEVTAGQQSHLVQWLSRRVGHILKIPDLSPDGYELMGGRVIPESGKAAAQFMYQDQTGRRLTLLVRMGGTDDTRFQFVHAEGLSAFSWVDDGLSFAMVAQVSRTALLSVAEAVYTQTDPLGRNPLPPQSP